MIYLGNYDENRAGGGWTFLRNFKKAMGSEVTDDYSKADTYFIAGPTMAERDQVKDAKRHGKKIVLRIDNAVRNSRNRNTGMSRMKDFATWADVVVYQSRWAKDYLDPFLNVGGEVIHNSVDESIYYGPNTGRPLSFIYSRFNRDETKGWEMARYYFSRAWMRDNSAHLKIVGNFSPELLEGHFDFYQGERYDFFGVQTPDVLADLYRTSRTLIAPYFCDAFSNTIIEALLCGCEVFEEPMIKTGGTAELLESHREFGDEYFHLDRMAAQYRQVIDG